MPKRSSKKNSRKKSAKKTVEGDENEVAANIIELATEGVDDKRADSKNPAAVALGRLGGLKGGKARALKLTKEKRSEIARKAANIRWSK